MPGPVARWQHSGECSGGWNTETMEVLGGGQTEKTYQHQNQQGQQCKSAHKGSQIDTSVQVNRQDICSTSQCTGYCSEGWCWVQSVHRISLCCNWKEICVCTEMMFDKSWCWIQFSEWYTALNRKKCVWVLIRTLKRSLLCVSKIYCAL